MINGMTRTIYLLADLVVGGTTKAQMRRLGINEALVCEGFAPIGGGPFSLSVLDSDQKPVRR